LAKSSAVPPYVLCQTTPPTESSFRIQASAPPAPKECVLPATMNPPSERSEERRAETAAVPRYVLCQTTPPTESSFRIQASAPPAPKECVLPATMNPLSDVCCTELAKSSAVPPYVLCQTTPPTESSFRTQTSKPPAPKECVLPATMNPPSE